MEDMDKKTLLEVIRHEDSHDCRCSDPEGACMICFRANEELEKRGVYTGHYQ